MAARSDDTGGGQKGGGALRIVGVVVLALAAVGFGAVRMGFLHLPGSATEDAVLSKPQDAPESGSRAAETSPAPKSAAAPSHTAGNVDLDAPATEPGAPTRRPGTRSASTAGSGSALVTAVSPEPANTAGLGRVDEHVTYQYNALGRRDPFQPMVGGEFVGDDVGGDAPVDIGGMKVVGIVWGTEDKFAMVEDGRGQSLVLRVGDKVMNGVVEGLRRDAVVVRITADGQSQSVAIPLTRKGDKSNATR
jgi:hypothetical protein